MVDVFHPPASVISSWPAPNYVNPQTHGPGLVVICILMATMGIIIVSIRLYARAFITRALGIDDTLIVGATFFAIGLSVLNAIGSIKYYSDHHVWDIPIHMYVPHRINIWVSEICVTMALSLTKISILLFYRRLSATFSRTFFVAVWVGIIYNILYMISFILAICLLCRPLSAFWLDFDPLYYHAHLNNCGEERVMEPLTAIFSSVSDAYTTILPMVLVSHLDMPFAQKRALYFLFGIGFLVVITGVIRIIWLYVTLTVDYDFTWKLWEMWVISQVEMWMAIYVACGPALKPIIKKVSFFLGSTFSEVNHKISGKGYNGSARYAANGTKRFTAAEGDLERIESTEELFELGKGVRMSNGEIIYAVESRFSGIAHDGPVMQHAPTDEAKTRQARRNRWKSGGSWGSIMSGHGPAEAVSS